eukprot:TRINITY_DN36428_c0_g2_i1.p1 TRINITY_DN36428_c0_g2~~TRINITY_DN36428_c0_g2_i1.p1  ORF type:complete len:474 (+),score=81.00 TRINITY_DN36428_c0_g2_i1:71-1492(+)
MKVDAIDVTLSPPREGASWKASELVVHWQQLAALWVAGFITSGVVYQSPAVFLTSFADEFGLSEYDASWLPSAFLLSFATFSIPTGALAQAVGPTKCFQAGCSLVIAVSCCYPFANAFWELLIIQVAYGLAYALSGFGMMLLIVPTRFDRQLATAVAILLSGYSLAGVILVPLMSTLISTYGWRHALLLAPVLTIAVEAPLVFFVLQDGERDASCRTVPTSRDDAEQSASEAPQPEAASLLPSGGAARKSALPASFLESLTLGSTWHTAFFLFYSQYIMIGLINELALFLNKDVGLDLVEVSSVGSTVFAVSFCGKMLVGMLLDSPHRRVATVGSYVMMIVGTSLPLAFFASGHAKTSQSQLVLFGLVFGFAFGTCAGVMSATPAKLFCNMSDFKKLQSFFTIFQVLGGFCGTLISGKVRTMTGSYMAAFCMFLGSAILCLVHVIALELSMASQTPEDRQHAAEEPRASSTAT